MARLSLSDAKRDVGWTTAERCPPWIFRPTGGQAARCPPYGRAANSLSPHQRAFTLLEVLIALAIFASVAAVLLSASARSLQNASRLEEKSLAGWLADNYLTELQLADTPPAIGADSLELAYAGRQWQLYSETTATSEPGMRRVDVWVAVPHSKHGRSPVKERSTLALSGFVGVPQ